MTGITREVKFGAGHMLKCVNGECFMATKEMTIYTVQLEPAEEGGFFVTVPALEGCFTQGETEEEALSMAEEAIAAYLESMAREEATAPEPS